MEGKGQGDDGQRRALWLFCMGKRGLAWWGTSGLPDSAVLAFNINDSYLKYADPNLCISYLNEKTHKDSGSPTQVPSEYLSNKQSKVLSEDAINLTDLRAYVSKGNVYTKIRSSVNLIQSRQN